uniref:LRRNT domain-containing protein n=1 Tax=Panagrolaimus sp. PS1159 TaxID=55785 RepID=A0AC35FJ18_9BILA
MKNYNSLLFIFIILLCNICYCIGNNENCPNRCACALLTVVCTGQALTSIPLNIPPGTIRLDLQQNQISNIYKDDFKNLSSLKYLDLSNNALQTIEEDAFADLINLERIRLNKNKLKQLPDYLFHRMQKLNRL